MSRKRRIFDIELPGDSLPDSLPQSVPDTPQRRGPMASAIAENADAIKDRRTAEAEIRAENDALAHAYVAAKNTGLVVEEIPLDDVHTHLLVRDRLPGEDPELDDLITSLREVGLSNPIRVEGRADGSGYELVQGHRRLTAYRALYKETGDPVWAKIPALHLPSGEGIATLYRRMVDENIVRKDLSFAEMAMAARNYADDPATDAMTIDDAVAQLFKSASYGKRSYIRSFARLLDKIGDTLLYPAELPRNLGVAVLKQIDERPELASFIHRELFEWETRSVSDELDVLRRVARMDPLDDVPVGSPVKPARKSASGSDTAKTKTTFDIRTGRGRVKCTAGVGRLEIKTDRDFSTMDRARLERAIAALIDGLE